MKRFRTILTIGLLCAVTLLAGLQVQAGVTPTPACEVTGPCPADDSSVCCEPQDCCRRDCSPAAGSCS